jgi:hypothetical protein
LRTLPVRTLLLERQPPWKIPVKRPPLKEKARPVRKPPSRPLPRATESDPELVEGLASRNTDARPAVGTNDMVSAVHPLATKAGLEVLEDGGNQR